MGSVMLLSNEVESEWNTLHSAHGGAIGFMDAKTFDLDTEWGVVQTMAYKVSLLDGLEQTPFCLLARYIVDRTPDKGFLINWRRTHGRVWPEPQEALPYIVKVMLTEYMNITSMAWDNIGMVIDARFEDLLVQHGRHAQRPRRPEPQGIPPQSSGEGRVPAAGRTRSDAQDARARGRDQGLRDRQADRGGEPRAVQEEG